MDLTFLLLFQHSAMASTINNIIVFISFRFMLNYLTSHNYELLPRQPNIWDILHRFVISELFRKRPYLNQIAIGIGNIACALAPRLSGGRKDRLCAIVERILVFPIYISEGGYIKCQFYSTIEPLRILKLLRNHLFEGVSGKEDDAHIAQLHLHVGLNAIPIGGEAECTCVEIDSCFVVVGEESYGIEGETRTRSGFFHCFIFFSLMRCPSSIAANVATKATIEMGMIDQKVIGTAMKSKNPVILLAKV